ncbi:hypothetical protein GCM10008960_26650 [Deinococcus sedimenti]|uniref:Uncharacterized protein n=1 Tax=Deinococcus sedimenti TaxID=1867090 RepID=A0ABQ2S7Y5_9DEIO|nr:hypothetical protein GCM10008960_26650 [Deinococcus sedimenti]
MALQRGEVLAVRGVPGGGFTPVHAEALTQGLGDLSLEGLEVAEGAGVQAMSLDALGAVAHHGHPVGRRDGPRGDRRLGVPLDGLDFTQGGDLSLHHVAGTGEAGFLLALQRGGAQDGPGGLTLRPDGRTQEALQRRGRTLRSSLGWLRAGAESGPVRGPAVRGP